MADEAVLTEEEAEQEARRKRIEKIRQKYAAVASSDVAANRCTDQPKEVAGDSQKENKVVDGNSSCEMDSGQQVHLADKPTPQTDLDTFVDERRPGRAKRPRLGTNDSGFSEDMFADLDAESPLEKQRAAGRSTSDTSTNLESSLLFERKFSQNDEDWDDASGYYIFKTGELIESRYEVVGQKGRGVFSNVAFATRRGSDGKENGRVAIKVLRRNETMRRAGSKEETLLQEIHLAAQQSRKYIVDYIESFYHRQHLCLVFEAMKMNLRQVLYRFGRHIGINIEGVRRYGKHILRALMCLSDLGIVHADLKLDNILVSEDLQVAKLCDFGCAFHDSEPRGEDTTYLVSRFYRAPEVILGLPKEYVSKPIDLWALATCMFELYAGNVMFPGRTNNEMLYLIMKTKGRFPNRIVRKHISSFVNREPHFDPKTLAFRHVVVDSSESSKSATTSQIALGSEDSEAVPSVHVKVQTVQDQADPSFTVLSMLNSSKASATQDHELLVHLARLIDRALVIDPSSRISIAEALESPFFK